MLLTVFGIMLLILGLVAFKRPRRGMLMRRLYGLDINASQPEQRVPRHISLPFVLVGLAMMIAGMLTEQQSYGLMIAIIAWVGVAIGCMIIVDR